MSYDSFYSNCVHVNGIMFCFWKIYIFFFTIFLSLRGCLKSPFSLHKHESLKTITISLWPLFVAMDLHYCLCDFANADGRSITTGVRRGMPLGAEVSCCLSLFAWCCISGFFFFFLWPYFIMWPKKVQTSQAKETKEGQEEDREVLRWKLVPFLKMHLFRISGTCSRNTLCTCHIIRRLTSTLILVCFFLIPRSP